MLAVCSLLVVMQLYAGIPLVHPVADDLGASGAATALTTAFSLGYAAGFAVFGVLSDHVGRKPILLIGLSALAISTAAVSLAPSQAALAVLRALQGLVAASFPATAIAYLNEAPPEGLRATAAGALSTAFIVAAIAGQAYASVVADVLGWRWGFALAALMFTLAVPLLAATLARSPGDGPAQSLGARFRRLPALAGGRSLAPLLAVGSALLLSFVAVYSALGPRLEGSLGFTSREVLLVRVAGLPAMLLAPLAGRLAGRIGGLPIAVGGLLLAALGLLAAAFASASQWPLIVASELYVSGYAATVPALIVLVAARTEGTRGAGISLYSLAAFAGASLGPALAAALGFAQLLIALAATLALAAGGLAASEPARDPLSKRRNRCTSARPCNPRSASTYSKPA